VCITKELDYKTYLNYAGLEISSKADEKTGKNIFSITWIHNLPKE
jgi:hypothetical protein